MSEIEWRQVYNSENDWEYRQALIEAQREIAEQLNRMNDQIAQLIQTVSSEDENDD